MLPCVCSVIDHRRNQNVVRTSMTHSAIALCDTFLFLPHFDVISDLLLADARQNGIYVLKCLWSKKFFCVYLKFVVSWLRNEKRNSTKPTKTPFFLPPNNLKIHQIVSRGLGTSLCSWQRWWRRKCLEELLLLTYSCKRPLVIHSVLSLSWISS